jgi:hypothetical protein
MRSISDQDQLIFSSTSNHGIVFWPMVTTFFVATVISFAVYFLIQLPSLMFLIIFIGVIIGLSWFSLLLIIASRKSNFYEDYADLCYIILSGIPSLVRMSYNDIEWYNVRGKVIQIKSPKVNLGDINEIGFYTQDEIKEIEKIFVSKNIKKKIFNEN